MIFERFHYVPERNCPAFFSTISDCRHVIHVTGSGEPEQKVLKGPGSPAVEGASGSFTNLTSPNFFSPNQIVKEKVKILRLKTNIPSVDLIFPGWNRAGPGRAVIGFVVHLTVCGEAERLLDLLASSTGSNPRKRGPGCGPRLR